MQKAVDPITMSHKTPIGPKQATKNLFKIHKQKITTDRKGNKHELGNKPWGDKPIMRLVKPARTDKEEAQRIPLDGQLSWLYADLEEIIDGN